MFRKLFCILTLVAAIVVVGIGIPVLAQDVCVTDYIANLAQPTTVAELRQYIDDLREVLSECDPVSEDAIEIEVQAVADYDDTYEDENGCNTFVFLGARTDSPIIFGMITGNSKISSLMERKMPGESKYEAADRTDDETLDDIMMHLWDDNHQLPKGRYELRYESFIGAEPITIAFEVEHNAEHRFVVIC